MRMRPLWPLVNRYLTLSHRWAGVVLCLLFVVWFVSGAVLHFVGFPSLPVAERIAGSTPIDLSRLKVAPAEALAQVAGADSLQLVGIVGRPVYLILSDGGRTAIAGDTGERLGPISGTEATAIAAAFAQARVKQVAGPLDYDQWVVHERFDSYRPFFRVSLEDPRRTDLYVSARTGEVVQRTRALERRWNWCGAVMHWIFFTPVRRHWSFWNQLVWGISLSALLTSVLGTWLGLHRYLKMRAARRGGASPFRGWLRWHHLIGLFASVVVLGWMASGWLAMDYGRLFSRGGPTAEKSQRVRGMSLAGVAHAATLDVLRSVEPGGSVIELNAVAGRPFLTIYGLRTAAPTRVYWLDTGEQATGPLPQNLLVDGVQRAWAVATSDTEPSSADELYRLEEALPADALALRAGAGGELRVYVDRYSGRVLAAMDASRRAYAWAYYGIHTLNFPGLISHPAARTLAVVLLVVGGLGFSITATVLGVRRVRLQFSR